MAIVALAFAVLEFGSATDFGIVLLAGEIPVVILLLLGGVFADRLPRRAILISSDLVKGAAQAGTALLLVSGTANVWTVALMQVVYGVAGAFSRPATLGLVKDVVSDARLQEANALLHLSRSVSLIVGPAIGALIVATGSPALALVIDAVTFGVSALLMASMRLAAVVRAVGVGPRRPARWLARVRHPAMGGRDGGFVRTVPAHVFPRHVRARAGRCEG